MRKFLLPLWVMAIFILSAAQPGASRAAGSPTAQPNRSIASRESSRMGAGVFLHPALQATVSPAVTFTPRGRPTRTPRPTPTPLTIPPPSDPESANLMIGFGALVVIVIVAGVWLNRSRTG